MEQACDIVGQAPVSVTTTQPVQPQGAISCAGLEASSKQIRQVRSEAVMVDHLGLAKRVGWQ